MISYVFVSYSREDRINAEVVADKLRVVGYKPWIDFEGIIGGNLWLQSIETALEQSVALIVLLTPSSAQSEWVRYECLSAQKHSLTIIPLIMRPCSVPDFLEKYQYVDFLTGFDAAFSRLQRALLAAVMNKIGDQVPVSEAEADTFKAVLPLESPKRILVIEDSKDTQDFIGDICAEFGTVTAVGTRMDAIPLIRREKFDFITLDMQLGPADTHGESGLYLLDLWKEYQPKTPLVIISRLPWDKNKMREFFKTYTVLDVLDKPLNPSELRPHLRHTLRSE